MASWPVYCDLGNDITTFPHSLVLCKLAILYYLLATPQQLISYLNSICNQILMSNLICNTNICTGIKLYTSTFNPLRLQKVLPFFQLSSGKLYQTCINTDELSNTLKIFNLYNCRYQNICSSSNFARTSATRVMISTIFKG